MAESNRRRAAPERGVSSSDSQMFIVLITVAICIGAIVFLIGFEIGKDVASSFWIQIPVSDDHLFVSKETYTFEDFEFKVPSDYIPEFSVVKVVAYDSGNLLVEYNKRRFWIEWDKEAMATIKNSGK